MLGRARAEDAQTDEAEGATFSFFDFGPGIMLKFCKNLTGPCGAPTYLPTYLPYLWETKKEITGRVKVGYYTN